MKIEYNDAGEKIINGSEFLEIKSNYLNGVHNDHLQHLKYFFDKLDSQKDLPILSKYLKDNNLGSIPTVWLIKSVINCPLLTAVDIYHMGFRE
ncbi:MAG: hypothetical protein MUC49_08955 [Raineya sp.]|nr:hypothetical protein [Raineya sp.]